MFLDLDIPDDDPLRPAKIYVSTAAPGFRVYEKDSTLKWESDFIWLIVVNEEDGLDFRVRQTIDGEREIQSFWKEQELETSKLLELLQEDPMWEIFSLRAVVLLQGRVQTQIDSIQAVQDTKRDPSVRETPWRLAERLRSQEHQMLERIKIVLASQVRSSFPTRHANHTVPLMSNYCRLVQRRPPWKR